MPKVNELDLGSGLMILIDWVGPKVNELDLNNGLGSNLMGF